MFNVILALLSIGDLMLLSMELYDSTENGLYLVQCTIYLSWIFSETEHIGECSG